MCAGRGGRIGKCISRVPQSFRELKSVGKTPEAASTAEGSGTKRRPKGGKKKRRTLYPPSYRRISFFHAFYVNEIPPGCLEKLADFARASRGRNETSRNSRMISTLRALRKFNGFRRTAVRLSPPAGGIRAPNSFK